MQLQELTYDLANELELKEPRGALVAAVERGGPAFRAGLRPSDVIVAFDGKEVATTADLPRFIGSARPGADVPVEVWRNAARSKVRIAVEPQR